MLTLPIRIIADEHGAVKAVKCAEMELGEPDESGRRRPVRKPNSEFALEVDTFISALGTQSNPLLPRRAPDLATNNRGNVVADANGRTSKKATWAGGDIVTGSATVISAMGAGKRAAADIDKFLRG